MISDLSKKTDDLDTAPVPMAENDHQINEHYQFVEQLSHFQPSDHDVNVATGDFAFNLNKDTKQVYDNPIAAASNGEKLQGSPETSYFPFSNATQAMLGVFMETCAISEADMDRLLCILIHPKFAVADLPSAAKKLRKTFASVHSKQAIVKSSFPGFFQPTVVHATSGTVSLVHPKHVLQACLTIPSLAPFLSRGASLPLRLKGLQFQTWANTLDWFDHPFSSLAIDDFFFGDVDRFGVGSLLLFEFDNLQNGELVVCLGRVKGLFIDDVSKQLWVRMFTHEQLLVHETVDGQTFGIDWIQLGNSDEYDVFECSLSTMENIRVLTLQDQQFHRVVALFKGRVKCQNCNKWMFFRSDQVDFRTKRMEGMCCYCNEQQVFQFWSDPVAPSVFELSVPAFVKMEEVAVVPVKLAGDGFQIFSSVGLELDSYDWMPLCLSAKMMQTVRNSFTFATFPPSIGVREKLEVLTRVFAGLEQGFWAWNSVLGRFVWVIVCLGMVTADMPAAAKSAGLLDPSSATYCSRLTLVKRTEMLNIGQFTSAAVRTRHEEELARQSASLAGSATATAAVLQKHGLSDLHSPLLCLKSAYNLSQQHKHCSLHVWNLGCFHVMIGVLAGIMDPRGWAEVVAAVANNRELFPKVGNRFKDFKVGGKSKTKNGGGGTGVSVRVGGRKANGEDVAALMPTLLFVVATQVRRNGLKSSFVAELCSNVQDLEYWKNEAEKEQLGQLDIMQFDELLEDEHGQQQIAQAVVVTLVNQFSVAYTLSLSMFSNEDWETRHVFQGCGNFVDGIWHCSTFCKAFQNKPKTLAVLELAHQRITSGPAPLFSQLVRESAHRFLRWTKDRSNYKQPELWVTASLHTRCLLRFLLEGGTWNVFEIDVNMETGRPVEDQPLPRVQQELVQLLQDVFSGESSISKVISYTKPAIAFVNDWIEKRKKPSLLVGLSDSGRLCGLKKNSLRIDFELPWKRMEMPLTARRSNLLRKENVALEQNSENVRFGEFGKLKTMLDWEAELQVLKPGTIFRTVNDRLFRLERVFGCRYTQPQTGSVSTFALLWCRKVVVVEPDAHGCLLEGMPYDRVQVLNEFRLIDASIVVQVCICMRDCTMDCTAGNHGAIAVHACPENIFAVYTKNYFPIPTTRPQNNQ